MIFYIEFPLWITIS